MDNWRVVILIIVMVLSVLDLSLTYYYINKYRNWQPNKPYRLMEMNPLLVFLWNNTNLLIGTLIGGVIILTLDYLIIKNCHWVIILILGLLFIFALYNHQHNITLLNKLIEMYPSGSLPESVFGIVEGNN